MLLEQLKSTHETTLTELKKEHEESNQKLISKMNLQSESIRGQVEVKILYLYKYISSNDIKDSVIGVTLQKGFMIFFLIGRTRRGL